MFLLLFSSDTSIVFKNVEDIQEFSIVIEDDLFNMIRDVQYGSCLNIFKELRLMLDSIYSVASEGEEESNGVLMLKSFNSKTKLMEVNYA